MSLTTFAILLSIASVGLGIFSINYAITTRKKLNNKFNSVFDSFKTTNKELKATAENINSLSHKLNDQFNIVFDRFNATNKELTVTAEHINSLSHILETKKLDAFPENMSEIIALISEAESKIEVFVDYFAYGFYSHPEVFSGYFEIIQQQISRANNSENSFSLEVYCYNNELLEKVNNTIFKHDSWKEIKDSPKFQNYRNYYNDGNYSNENDLLSEIDALSNKEEFFNYLIQKNNKYINLLFPEMSIGLPQTKNVRIKRSNSEFPCFLWIKDNEEIILSFSGYQKRTGRCIQTKDKELIDLLRNELSSTFRFEEN